MKKNHSFKSLTARKLPKNDREQAVLMGLIELYLKTNKPIGSQTLQENGFESLSTATIRNYFSKMEEAGYLKQPHTSGGRIPTAKAFRIYADSQIDKGEIDPFQQKALQNLFGKESREIASSIHQAAELLSDISKCAVFVSTPRFDQDFIQDIRLVFLDGSKLLSILMTDFGLLRTEVLYTDELLTPKFLHTTQEYFLWRMNKGEKPFFEDDAEAKAAQRIYNEIMVRHVVGYANFPEEDILRTGFSKLLAYEEFNDAVALGKSLSLLENETQMRTILRESIRRGSLSSWIGDELHPHVPLDSECSVIAIPYRINQIPTGAIALLGPMRLQYRNTFGLLETFSNLLSKKLTERLYKFKITFREPQKTAENGLQHHSILLENKPKEL